MVGWHNSCICDDECHLLLVRIYRKDWLKLQTAGSAGQLAQRDCHEERYVYILSISIMFFNLSANYEEVHYEAFLYVFS